MTPRDETDAPGVGERERPAASESGNGQADLRRQKRQVEALRRCAEALFAHADADAVAREAVVLARQMLDADAALLYLREPAGPAEPADTLRVRGADGPALPEGPTPVTWQEAAEQIFRTGRAPAPATATLLALPVGRPEEESSLGVLQVLRTDGKRAFNAGDRELLEVLCVQAATAIEHAQLAEAARRAEIVHVIGDISHDIKNLLTPIQSGVWTLVPILDTLFERLDAIRACCPEGQSWGEEIAQAMADAREDYRWILADALDAAEKVQARTKEIADAIKGELAPPVFEQADLNQTAHEVARSLRLMAERTGVRLELDLDPQLPRAPLDRKQMYNALYNLVNNAVEATPEDGIVTVRTRRPQPGEGTLLIEVEDTGQGIPEHIRKRLFTSETISTKPGGTGLGTRIVAGVVRRHNGTITVRSEMGHGSTFTIRLPRTRRRTEPEGAKNGSGSVYSAP